MTAAIPGKILRFGPCRLILFHFLPHTLIKLYFPRILAPFAAETRIAPAISPGNMLSILLAAIDSTRPLLALRDYSRRLVAIFQYSPLGVCARKITTLQRIRRSSSYDVCDPRIHSITPLMLEPIKIYQVKSPITSQK